MPKILVTGARGQLGSEIQELSDTVEGDFYFTDIDELDITDKKALGIFIEKNKIDTIINCAAYTAVDKAEDNQDLANLINNIAVRYMAEIAEQNDIKIIHVSTDYIFDGKNHKPYIEEDKPCPNSVYGETKLAGEKALQEVSPNNSIIIRTSWVYSSFGANFVKTMLRLGKEKEELGVIYDQVGTPTYARDLAKVILDILPKLANTVSRSEKFPRKVKNQTPDIYHYSNEGAISWYDFAKEIMKMAKLECKINPLETFQYPTPAKRPHYSLLNKAKIKNKFGVDIPYWKDSLSDCLIKLGEKN